MPGSIRTVKEKNISDDSATDDHNTKYKIKATDRYSGLIKTNPLGGGLNILARLIYRGGGLKSKTFIGFSGTICNLVETKRYHTYIIFWC